MEKVNNFEWENLTHLNQEVALIAINTASLYPYYLAACAKCAGAIKDGIISGEVVINAFQPVVKMTLAYCRYTGNYIMQTWDDVRAVALYLYNSEKDDIIKDLVNGKEILKRPEIFETYCGGAGVHTCPGTLIYRAGEDPEYIPMN